MSTHDIHVVKKYASGAEEWLCPLCRRHFIVQWSPEYQFIILEPGDTEAIHNMGRGAMALAVSITDPTTEHLRPWIEWLESINIQARLGEEGFE